MRRRQEGRGQMSNLTQNFGVGVATTVLGLAGGWYLQDGQHKTEIADQRSAAERTQKDQEDQLKLQEIKERQLTAYKAAYELFQTWHKPEFVEDERIARSLLLAAGRHNYNAIVTNPATTDRQKQALARMLEFFDQVRGLAAADTDEMPLLNVSLARQLFGDSARWWSQSGLRILLQDEGEAAPEIENAAYGMAALGYDVSGQAPKLKLDVAMQFLNMVPPVSVTPARYAERSVTVQPTVLSLADLPATIPDLGASSLLKMEQRCLRSAFDADPGKIKVRVVKFEDWRAALTPERKRELVRACKVAPPTLISSDN